MSRCIQLLAWSACVACVTAPVLPSQVQPNTPEATLLVDGLEAPGFAGTDPVLAAIGQDVVLTMDGLPGAPFAVLVGPALEPGLPTALGVANLDPLGFSTVVSGFSGPGVGVWMLDATGTFLSAHVSGQPAGQVLSLQALIQGGTGPVLTAPASLIGVPGDPIPAGVRLRTIDAGFPGTEWRRCVVEDVDGDGNTDIVNNSGTWLGDGALGFSFAAVDPNGIEMAVGDLVGDANLDLVVVLTQVQIHAGDGTGAFSATPTLTLPVTGEDRGNVCLVDLDQDQDLDIVVSDGATLSPGVVRYVNLGGGSFVLWGETFESGSRTCAAPDLNNDGKPELVVDLIPAGGGIPAATTRILWGNFAPFHNLGLSALLSGMPEAGSLWIRHGDFDGDGDVDLLWSGETAHGILENDGTPVFPSFTYAPLPGAPASCCPLPNPEPADVDDDGDLDVVYIERGTSGRDWLVVLANDGSGQFPESWYLPLRCAPGTATHVEPGDLDGDGDTDLVVGGSTTTLVVNEN